MLVSLTQALSTHATMSDLAAIVQPPLYTPQMCAEDVDLAAFDDPEYQRVRPDSCLTMRSCPHAVRRHLHVGAITCSGSPRRCCRLDCQAQQVSEEIKQSLAEKAAAAAQEAVREQAPPAPRSAALCPHHYAIRFGNLFCLLDVAQQLALSWVQGE